ncbi:MAG: hypothetical protein GY910_19820 [bacterium]|nr:hypothetical protein [bacterium]
MSASTRIDRMRSRPEANRPRRRRSEDSREKRSWIGVDFANLAATPPSPALLPLLALALIVALAVASLRIDLIRTRYALATAMEDETKLIDEQHVLIVEKLRLRDPTALAVHARERGFRPARVVRSLADPMPLAGPTVSGLEILALPAVSSRPPDGDPDGHLGAGNR